VAEWYGKRFDDYRLPGGHVKRTVLAELIGADGITMLTAAYQDCAPQWLHQLPAVETLRQVWVQQYHAAPPGQPVRWRASADTPPAAQRIRSPHDVQARLARKRTTEWTGYKVHLSETCDEDTPNLITNVLTTNATTSDWDALYRVHDALASKDLLPAEHLTDAGYIDAGALVASQREHAVELLGPVIEDHSWQARAGQGFATTDFNLDWQAGVATCPQGAKSRKWSQTHDQHKQPIINIRFDPADCRDCPMRTACTSSKTGPRNLTVRLQEQHTALQATRAYQKTREFKERYPARAGIEGTINQGVNTTGMRRARYKGLAKTRLQHVLTAAAINLQRAGDWLAGIPSAHTRVPPFIALAKTTT
jgi:transposase